LPSAIRQKLRDGDKEQVITLLKEVDLLVLDDLGAEEEQS